MPVMDGYEATHEIRNSEKEDAKSIPIIAMTANAFDDDMKKSKTAGMGAHLSKPLAIYHASIVIQDSIPAILDKCKS